MEQELSASLGERQVAKFIQHHQIQSGETLGQFAAPSVQLLLLQLVDQVEQVEVPAPLAVSDCLPRD